MSDPEYLTPKELAARWRIPENRLAQWRWHGHIDLNFKKIGRDIRYLLEEVEAFERRAQRKSTSDDGRF